MTNRRQNPPGNPTGPSGSYAGLRTRVRRPQFKCRYGNRCIADDHLPGYEHAGRSIRLAFEIKELRERKGLSQRQLAEVVGTTQSAIARLEGGRFSLSLLTLDRIANALDAELTVTLTDTQRLLGAR